MLAWLPLLAAGADYQAGKDYSPVLQPAPENSDAKHVKVEEFFWYGCPHCYALEPALEKWVAKAKGITFVRVPNSLGRDVGVLHSKTFYAAESMNVTEKVHKPIFDALHADPGSLVSAETISAFVGKTAGVAPSAFAETLNSFFVDSQSRRAQQLAMDYGVTGTPSIVVDGRYLVPATNPPENMLPVVDFLVEKARKDHQKDKPKK